MKSRRREYHHPWMIRVTHWVNFLALGIMVTSGLRIYNASPLFDFTIPSDLTLGGWLAGARQWHFFGMWLFAVNGLVYVFYNLSSKHGRRTTIFRSSDAAGVMPMILYYLRIRKVHPEQKKYNALQKMAYTLIPLVAIGSVATGMAIYWPVQFSWVARLFGSYDTARVWHFLFMAALVAFFLGHLVMVAIAGWWNFVSIFTGWRNFPVPPEPPPAE